MLQLGRDSGCLCLEQRQQGNRVAAKTWGAFQKFRKLFKFRNAKHHSTSKIREIPGAKLNGKNFREN